MTHPERQAVIRGFGSSKVGRRLPASEMALTVDACLAALADAGVERDEIDGLATFPGGGFDTPGLAGPGADEVHAALGLQTNWKFGGPEGGQLSGFFSACLAVATGLARHVLVYRTVGEASAQGAAGRAGGARRGSRRGRLGVSPLAGTVRRALTGELDCALRPAAHARIRHHP